MSETPDLPDPPFAPGDDDARPPADGTPMDVPLADAGPDSGARAGAGEHPIRLATLPWDVTDPHDDRSLPPWFRRAVITVLTLMVAFRVVVWGFGELASFWYTLFLAFFIGLTLEPMVNRMAARGMRRGVATIAVMLGLLGVFVAFLWLFGGLLADQLAQLIRSVPSILANVLDFVNAKAGTEYTVNELLGQLGIGYEDLAQSAANLGLGLLSILSTAVGLVFNMFTVALFAFFFAADGPRFRRTVASWLSPTQQRTFLTVWDIATQKAGGYVISRLILAMISATFHGIVFVALDLPYWLPMALWVGLVSQFIPTIGTYLAGALPILIALVGGHPFRAVIVLVAVIVYQQVENYFVAPRVTQSTLEIHPAVAFGSVLVGSALFGAMGALLSIPVVATLQSLISVYGRRYELLTEFGASAGATDRERMDAAIRATDDEVGAAARPRPPHAPWPRTHRDAGATHDPGMDAADAGHPGEPGEPGDADDDRG